MKILLLADINSAHTQKWVTALTEKGAEIGLFSLSAPLSGWFEKSSNFQLLYAPQRSLSGSLPGILGKVPRLKKEIRLFQPDVLHAHYASSYGLLGARSGFHPFVISAWGSDVMEFPGKSPLHRWIIKHNLKKADLLLSTSKALTRAMEALGAAGIKEIPFGIDTAVFSPRKVEGTFPDENIVLGTVKSLEHIYGTDLLIRAFAALVQKRPELPLSLFIVGGGSREKEYRDLAEETGIADRTVFTGRVDFSKASFFHNRIDVFVNPSRNESFGVSVLEASACEKPVIASDTGGLKEVVMPEKTGILVPPEDVAALTKAMERLAQEEELRNAFGKQGRAFVLEHFDLSRNVESMMSYYSQLIKTRN